MEFDTFVRRFGYLIILLFVMSSLSTPAITDTIQSDLLLQSFGPSLSNEDGSAQTIIDQLTKRLTREPYRAELYYHLAHAYDVQGWQDKAAQYMSQWIKLSNPDTVTQETHAFVLDEKSDAILVIDRVTGEVTRRIDVGWSPKKLVPTPNGSKLYVTNALANSVSAIDTKEMSVTDTIGTGRMPWNGKASPQGDRVYVTNLRSDNVSVIDTKDNTVLETVEVGKGPWGVAVSPDGHRLYVSNQNSQDIQVIDTGSYSVVDIISVGTHPRDIALAPNDENKLYAIDNDIVSDEIEIYVVDLNDSRIVKALGVPATNDPFLKPFEQMSMEDKLALLKNIDTPAVKASRHIPKPKLRGLPALVAMSGSPPPLRPVVDRDYMPGEIDLPTGGPAPLAGPKPLMQAYVSVPAVSNSRPMPFPEPDQLIVPEESETEEVQYKIEQEKKSKNERRIMRIVVVVQHDSLWNISLDNYGSVDSDIIAAIQDLNPAIKNPDRIYVGQEIKLPVLKTYEAYEGKAVEVRTNDNLYQIAMRNYGIASDKIYAEIQKANPRIRNITFIRAGQKIILPNIPNTPFREGSV